MLAFRRRHWTPRRLPGTVEWWDAPSISGIPEAGVVTTWTGKIGATALTQAGADSLKPLFQNGVRNGLPIVRFDGIDDFLTGAFTEPAAGFTLSAVINFVTLGAAQETGISGSAATRRYLESGTGNGNKLVAVNGAVLVGNTTLVANTWYVQTLIYNAAGNSSLRINGTEDKTAAGSVTAGNTMVFGRAQPGAAFAPVDIGEVVFTSAILASGDAVRLEKYMGWRWNIGVA